MKLNFYTPSYIGADGFGGALKGMVNRKTSIRFLVHLVQSFKREIYCLNKKFSIDILSLK